MERTSEQKEWIRKKAKPEGAWLNFLEKDEQRTMNYQDQAAPPAMMV
jgi:hypothetical protein